MENRTAERKPGYNFSEKAMFTVCVEIFDALDVEGVVEQLDNCRSLEEAQRRFIALRDGRAFPASQMGFGAVFDEAGKEVATISYNGRLWPPLGGRVSPWAPGTEPILEAPAPDDPDCEEPDQSPRP